MTDKNISVDIIKEISTQLQALYGHATTDILPIVLHAISMKSIFDFIGNVAFFATFPILYKFLWVPFLNRKQRENQYSCDFEMETMFGSIALTIFSILSPFAICHVFSEMIYIFSPEAKIIFSILDGLR